jgi:hypothetical protein
MKVTGGIAAGTIATQPDSRKTQKLQVPGDEVTSPAATQLITCTIAGTKNAAK